MAFREDSTGIYTFSEGSTGSTVDLGARNTYRYINAVNVYNKGKEDGVTAAEVTKLTISSLVCTSHTFILHGSGETIAVNTDIATWHDGIRDAALNIGFPYISNLNSAQATFKVTFNKTVKLLVAVITYESNPRANAGIRTFMSMKINNTTYNAFNTNDQTQLPNFTISPDNNLMIFPFINLAINSNTLTFQAWRTGGNHLGTDEVEFYGY